MDDSPQIQEPTLNPSQKALSLPAYRRRPIRSRTYQSLLQILPYCPVASFQGDLRNVETMKAGEEIGVIGHIEVNRKESEDNALFQETFTGKSKKEVVSEDTSFDVEQTAVLKLGQVNVAMNGGQVDSQMNTVNVQDYMATENQSGNTGIRMKNDREKMKCDNPVPIDDFDPFELLNADEDFSIDDFSEVLDSCFELEMADKPSQDGGNDQKYVSTLGETMPKEVENELQMTEMELEKLINNPGVVESSSCPTFDNEIEEGEISEDAVIGDASLDALSEDIVLPEERSTNLVHTSGCYKEDFDRDEERGPEQHYSCDSSLVNRVSKGKHNVKVETRTAPDYNFIYGFQESYTNVQTAGPVAGSPVASGRILQDRAGENQICLSNRKDDNTNKKKRTKGPMTEERKAKKKKKDRKKIAEKNRELGVKMLKLPTVLKPKKITYCRHYMQGKCHEGEQCKFSHDTVPLTKSKPCGYFARNSCMKGDDCPFDHELSKYPCNNYATTGFCSRGSGCLFSHEIPTYQGHPVAPNASKPKLMSEHQMIRKDVASKLSKPMAILPSPQKGSNSSR